MKRAMVNVIILAAVAAGAAYVMGRAPDAGPVYLTAKIERGKVMTTVTATGTVKAVATVEVGSQLSGQIDKLFVDFNDEVQQGQPLARLDQRSFLAKVHEAEATLEAAKTSVLIQEAAVERARSHLATARARVKVFRAKVAHAQIGIRDATAQIPVLQARLEKARAGLVAADANFQRTAKLHKQKLASGKDYDEAKARRAVAAAAIHEAEAVIAAQKEKIDIAGADLSEAEADDAVHALEIETATADLHKAEAELLNARATVAQKEAALTQARVELDRTVIRSPIKGVVIGRDIDEGQTVAASFEAPTLFKIARDLREMEVHGKIDEADIGRIRLGQAATFRVDAFAGRQFGGRVTQIRKAPEVVKNVVTYRVVIATRNTELLLLPGMTALVQIVVRETDEVLTLPNAALRFRPRERESAGQAVKDAVSEDSSAAEPDVWVLGDDGEPRPVRVRLGLSDETVTEVVEGPLQEGQNVVVGTVPEEGKRRLFGLRWGF